MNTKDINNTDDTKHLLNEVDTVCNAIDNNTKLTLLFKLIKQADKHLAKTIDTR